MRCILMTVGAPIGWVGQWLDVGVPIILPIWSEATYWENYWQAKHKEMKEYSSRPCYLAGGVHTMIPGKVPSDDELGANRTFVWIGGY